MFIQIFYYFLMALFLFLLNNFIVTKEKDKLLLPLLYLFVCAGFLELQHLRYNYIFIILVFEFLIELFYNYTLKDNKANFDINYFLKKYTILIILGIILENCIFTKVESILPSTDVIKTVIWLIVIIYIYNILENLFKSNKQNRIASPLYDKNYIISNYAKYKLAYHDILENYDKVIRKMVLAILIYEDYNTPKLHRNIDNLLFGHLKKVSKLGIMQVETKVFLTDEESIRFVCNALEKKYEIGLKKDNHKKLLKDYLSDYNKYNTIIKIYNTIDNFEKLS